MFATTVFPSQMHIVIAMKFYLYVKSKDMKITWDILIIESLCDKPS